MNAELLSTGDAVTYGYYDGQELRKLPATVLRVTSYFLKLPERVDLRVERPLGGSHEVRGVLVADDEVKFVELAYFPSGACVRGKP